jgi:hypothetical protein
MTPPDPFTCGILCQKLRTGQITVREWFKLGGETEGDLPNYEPCENCKGAGEWGATGKLPEGHAILKMSKGQMLVHDALFKSDMEY